MSVNLIEEEEEDEEEEEEGEEKEEECEEGKGREGGACSICTVHVYGVIMIQLEEYYTLYLQGGLSLKGEIKNFTNNEE